VPQSVFVDQQTRTKRSRRAAQSQTRATSSPQPRPLEYLGILTDTERRSTHPRDCEQEIENNNTHGIQGYIITGSQGKTSFFSSNPSSSFVYIQQTIHPGHPSPCRSAGRDRPVVSFCLAPVLFLLAPSVVATFVFVNSVRPQLKRPKERSAEFTTTTDSAVFDRLLIVTHHLPKRIQRIELDRPSSIACGQA
jgi:hypothetical protein